jgi:hypothetical protein
LGQTHIWAEATTVWVGGLGFWDVEIAEHHPTIYGALGQSRDQQPSNWLTNKQTLNLRKCNESRLGYAAGHLNNTAEVLFGHMTIAEYVPQQSTSRLKFQFFGFLF